MKSRVEIAKEKHRNGYNCCQAVVCTYCDLLGMDETLAFRASEAYGLGIAKRYETCGSVCGMMMLAGLKNSDANLEKPGSKVAHKYLHTTYTDKSEILKGGACGE